MRLSLDEVLAFLSAAWHTVAETTPELMVDDPGTVPFAWPPVAELRLSAEHRHDETTNLRDLRDLVDFAPFGTSDRDHLTEISVTITGPLRLSRDDRQARTRQGLAYMGQGPGFNDSMMSPKTGSRPSRSPKPTSRISASAGPISRPAPRMGCVVKGAS